MKVYNTPNTSLTKIAVPHYLTESTIVPKVVQGLVQDKRIIN